MSKKKPGDAAKAAIEGAALSQYTEPTPLKLTEEINTGASTKTVPVMPFVTAQADTSATTPAVAVAPAPVAQPALQPAPCPPITMLIVDENSLLASWNGGQHVVYQICVGTINKDTVFRSSGPYANNQVNLRKEKDIWNAIQAKGGEGQFIFCVRGQDTLGRWSEWEEYQFTITPPHPKLVPEVSALQLLQDRLVWQSSQIHDSYQWKLASENGVIIWGPFEQKESVVMITKKIVERLDLSGAGKYSFMVRGGIGGNWSEWKGHGFDHTPQTTRPSVRISLPPKPAGNPGASISLPAPASGASSASVVPTQATPPAPIQTAPPLVGPPGTTAGTGAQAPRQSNHQPQQVVATSVPFYKEVWFWLSFICAVLAVMFVLTSCISWHFYSVSRELAEKAKLFPVNPPAITPPTAPAKAPAEADTNKATGGATSTQPIISSTGDHDLNISLNFGEKKEKKQEVTSRPEGMPDAPSSDEVLFPSLGSSTSGDQPIMAKRFVKFGNGTRFHTPMGWVTVCSIYADRNYFKCWANTNTIDIPMWTDWSKKENRKNPDVRVESIWVRYTGPAENIVGKGMEVEFIISPDRP